MTDTLSRATACQLEPTAQQLLQSAIAFHEKAIKHHRHASLLYDRGDRRQANTHASIACTHARSALASGAFLLSEDAQLLELQPAV
jgi:hypothetical protein